MLKALKNENTVITGKIDCIKETRSNIIEKEPVETEVESNKEIPVIELENVFEQNQEEEQKDEKVSIPTSEMIGEKLMLRLPQNCEIKYVITSSEGTIKSPIMKNTIHLEKDDMVFVMTYENRVLIKKYQVTDIKEQNNSIRLCEYNINHINQIKLCDLSQAVEREVKNYFHLVGKPNQLL